MIRFAHPEYLYALGMIPVLALLFWLFLKARRSALKRFGTLPLVGRLSESTSVAKRITRFAVVVTGLALLMVGLANPQVGTRLEEVKQEGVDLFLALDVSLSMKAEDLRPNRLERAKLEIRNLIAKLGGDRIGLVVFAGDAFTQFPLTTDYGAANLFLDAVDVDAVPTPGTSVGAAIKRAMASFDFEEPTTKVIIIMTDGEATEGDAIEAAREAAEKKVLLYTVGFGSPAGAPIPAYNSSGERVDFKRDRKGNVVVTRLDQESLERIASIGKGQYYTATNTQDELQEIYENINSLEKRQFGVKQFTEYEDRFQFLIAGCLLLFVVELFISDRKSAWLARWTLLKKEEATA